MNACARRMQIKYTTAVYMDIEAQGHNRTKVPETGPDSCHLPPDPASAKTSDIWCLMQNKPTSFATQKSVPTCTQQSLQQLLLLLLQLVQIV